MNAVDNSTNAKVQGKDNRRKPHYNKKRGTPKSDPDNQATKGCGTSSTSTPSGKSQDGGSSKDTNEVCQLISQSEDCSPKADGFHSAKGSQHKESPGQQRLEELASEEVKVDSAHQTARDQETATEPVISAQETHIQDEAKDESEAHPGQEPSQIKREKVDRNFGFLFTSDFHGMRERISLAYKRLQEGHTVSIKAFGNEIQYAIRMAEILKMRIHMLFQDTQFISSSQGGNHGERQSQGILIKVSKKSVFSENHAGFQRSKPHYFTGKLTYF